MLNIVVVLLQCCQIVLFFLFMDLSEDFGQIIVAGLKSSQTLCGLLMCSFVSVQIYLQLAVKSNYFHGSGPIIWMPFVVVVSKELLAALSVVLQLKLFHLYLFVGFIRMAKIRQDIEYPQNVSKLRILMLRFSILQNLTFFCLGQSLLQVIHYLFFLHQVLYFFFKLLLPSLQSMKHLIFFHLSGIEAVGLYGNLLVVIED